jgi:hypothetical protein
MQFSHDRRRVLALGAAAGTMLAMDALLPGQALAQAKQVSLDECLSMTPEGMARGSSRVMRSWEFLKKTVAAVKDPKARAATLAILDNPAPTLLSRMDARVRGEVAAELVAKGYLKDAEPETFLPPAKAADKTPQPFIATAGSGYQSHHPYPGGLVRHTVGNLKISLGIYETYQDVYGFTLDRDTVIVAQALHDLHKPWVFQWQQDGSTRTEKPMAGTGEHHVLGVAESIVRGLPAPMVVAQACAHNHPGTDKDEAEVVGWICAASILAGVDPVRAGLLDRGGKSLPLPRRMEGFVTHLGDHDFVLTMPAAQWTVAALRELAAARYGMGEDDLKGARFNALRNYAFSQASAEALYREYATKGPDGLASAVTALVRPA